MAMFGQDDRTEKPTGRRLEDARKKGQVARSRNVTQVATLLVSLLVLSWTGSDMMAGLGQAVRTGLEQSGRMAHAELQAGILIQVALSTVRSIALIVGPLALAVAVTAVGSQVAQHGWVMSAETLRLDFSRLNPANGLARLGFKRAGIDLLLTLAIAGTVAYLAYAVVTGLIDRAPELARVPPAEAAAIGWGSAKTMLQRVGIALGAMAAIDFGLQKWRHLDSLKMTKQEVKDDNKMTEGNPEIKARVRRVQREMIRKRMLADTARATVVITNPTHYAVALLYVRATMSAPKVVAKGQNKLAARIKEIAREHDVPIVENKPLAQALYKNAEIGDVIPAALFEAVAEVLAYLIRLKRLVLQ